jgi:hypothetical protein
MVDDSWLKDIKSQLPTPSHRYCLPRRAAGIATSAATQVGPGAVEQTSVGPSISYSLDWFEGKLKLEPSACIWLGKPWFPIKIPNKTNPMIYCLNWDQIDMNQI